MSEEGRWAAEARDLVNAAGHLLVEGLHGDVPLADAVAGAQELLSRAAEAERERASAARASALMALEPLPPDGARQRLPSPLAAIRRVLRR